MLVYYVGSSVMGSAGGWFWSRWNWSGVAGFTAIAMLIAAWLGTRMRDEARSVENSRS
jgi:YNFM family putative membrane transporter